MMLLSKARHWCSLQGRASWSNLHPLPLKNSRRFFIKKSKQVVLQQTKESEKSSILPIVAKSFAFTGGFSCATFIGCSIWQYENRKKELADTTLSIITSQWNEMKGFENKEGSFRQELNRWWNNLPQGKKVFWCIASTNALVWLCWRHPLLNNFMHTYFVCNPVSKAVCWPMFLSTFSHHSALHFLCNMYVLHSFSGVVGNSLGMEQFIALYLTGGVLSSFASVITKLSLSISVIKPSLGASGAIMAFLGYFCTKYPDSRLGVAFIPDFNFSAKNGLIALILFDLCGVIFRFQLFDHAAHLGGAMYGMFYKMYGEHLWSKRTMVVERWRLLKNDIDS